MAQIVVDSGVMRDKAQTIETAATSIQKLYQEMLQEVNSMTGKMKGTTIETQQKQFAGMQKNFDTFATDMKSYSNFLKQAAEGYDKEETAGLQQAQQQGKF